MKWVAWRQSRLELIAGLIFLAALAAIFIPAGLEKHDLFSSLGLENLSRDADNYRILSLELVDSYGWLDIYILQFIPVVPILAGILFAVPLVMEFERRTYRLAWTQSITRMRWLVMKLSLALLAIIIFSALLSVLMSWLLSPQESVLGPYHNFAKHGIVPVAYAVFAFAVALAIGILSRRTALALVVALVVSVVTLIGVESDFRQHYITPVREVFTVTVSPMIVLNNNDAITGPAVYFQSGLTMIPGPIEFSGEVPDTAWVVDEYYITPSGNHIDYIPMSEENKMYTMEQVVYYHPESRYWAFQGIESAIFLGFSVLFLGTVVWVVKRRMT